MNSKEVRLEGRKRGRRTPGFPTNIIPTKIRLLDSNLPGSSLGASLIIKIMLKSNPLKSTMLVGRLGLL